MDDDDYDDDDDNDDDDDDDDDDDFVSLNIAKKYGCLSPIYLPLLTNY